MEKLKIIYYFLKTYPITIPGNFKRSWRKGSDILLRCFRSVRRFLFSKRKLLFVFLVIFSIIQLPVISSAYSASYGPFPEGEIPDRPIYYGNGDPYIPSGTGVSTILPIADVEVFFAYSTTNSSSNYENVSVTITNLYRYWVDGTLDYYDRTYVLENSQDFGYRNVVSITDPGTIDDAYYYNYKCTFDFGSTSERLTSAIFRFSDFWYVPELKNPSLGFTANLVRDIFSLDIRDSYFNTHDGSCRVNGSFMFMGSLERYSFDYMDDHGRYVEVGYTDIYNAAFGNNLTDTVLNPVPIYVQGLTIAVPLWNANVDSINFYLDVPVMLESEYDATYENAFVIDYYAEHRYSGQIDFGFDWLIDSVSAFFNAPLFEGLSFGSLVFIVLSISISTAVIALLSHLR